MMPTHEEGVQADYKHAVVALLKEELALGRRAKGILHCDEVYFHA